MNFWMHCVLVFKLNGYKSYFDHEKHEKSKGVFTFNVNTPLIDFIFRTSARDTSDVFHNMCAAIYGHCLRPALR